MIYLDTGKHFASGKPLLVYGVAAEEPDRENAIYKQYHLTRIGK
jgi:hypothetical protein